MVLEEIESLSKTTKLLLLDSLLQEVCIDSGSHVSHNLLYSGLKKAHLKMRIKSRIQLHDILLLDSSFGHRTSKEMGMGRRYDGKTFKSADVTRTQELTVLTEIYSKYAN